MASFGKLHEMRGSHISLRIFYQPHNKTDFSFCVMTALETGISGEQDGGYAMALPDRDRGLVKPRIDRDEAIVIERQGIFPV
jgi:hypothetical protein